jgi:carbamate kinase
LDVCSADTQGATGYMFQQALQCWLEQHGIHQEIVTLITQVVVNEEENDTNPSKKGIGPYFDRELAQQYHTTRGWDMEMVPGYGYRRAVPLLMPERIIETNSIRTLVESKILVICAGGGGIPVRIDAHGVRIGIDAVVDKAYTTALLAREIQAEAIIFVTPLEHLVGILGPDPFTQVRMLDQATLEILIEERTALDDPIRHKLIAGRTFLRSGGKLVMIVPPNELGNIPRLGYGIYLDNGDDALILRTSILDMHGRC